MRAIVQDVYGSADRLRLSEIERPVIAADEVLVQVRAAGVDRGTCHLMRGEPYLVRVRNRGGSRDGGCGASKCRGRTTVK
jgi:NADPH:quinone reductase-like Zn-dependent oxidoreductase